jgi:L-serine dehydratase
MISIFELFKVGIGPSSSHTVGPMIAAARFAQELQASGRLSETIRLTVDLYGSLALTGKGHATDDAVIAGVHGLWPESVEPARMKSVVERALQRQSLRLAGEHPLAFQEDRDLLFHRSTFLPYHPNALQLTAHHAGGVLLPRVFFSIGGGFVLRDDEASLPIRSDDDANSTPYPFACAQDLLGQCAKHSMRIDQIVHGNELRHCTDDQIGQKLDRIWEVMSDCIQRGCQTEGTLPGGLGVRRRAPGIVQRLRQHRDAEDPLRQLDWLSVYALAVNEENAAGGQVVTAPTNGASGIIPAVLNYYVQFYFKPFASGVESLGTVRDGIHRFLKTAGAIGLLYKRNASLSAAEMGCQGEVGVACSMAAAGLAACMGGSPAQIENAAEIGMEHNLGLTCDPVRGLVQVPCIERNTMGAAKAINAARLAVLYGDGTHRVSLDKVIETMRQTGIDMQSKYKETSLGGLAVNVVNC